MKKVTLAILAVFIFILFPFAVGAEIIVSLKLDRSEATLADSIRMVVHVSGTQKNSSRPVLRGADNFHVMPGGTSSRVEIINDQVHAAIEYTFSLQARKTGTFQIGPAEITIQGKTFRSNTKTLAILTPTQSARPDRGPLFLTAALSSSRVYVEQQAVYTLRLYRRIKAGDISLGLPEAGDLSFKRLGESLEYEGVIDGRTYQVLEVRYAVVPSKEGNYRIGPSRMNLRVYQEGRRSPGSLFDDSFFNNPFFSFSSGRPVTVTSEPLELTVVSLPEEGRPADFTGLVGSFEIESRLEPTTVRAGESSTMTVVLSGRGNVTRIPDLQVPEIEQTKVYADQPVFKVTQDAKGLGGSKTMKWALVPEKVGLCQIPPLEVSFFDPGTDEYRVIRTSPHALSVLPEERAKTRPAQDGKVEHGSRGTLKQAVMELGRDILPVHASIKDLSRGCQLQTGGGLFWAVLLGPLFAYAAGLWGLRLLNKSDQYRAAARRKNAAKTLAGKCSAGEVTSADLSSAVRDYFNDRFGLSLGAVTPDEAAEILTYEGVSLNSATRLRNSLKCLEDAIYTGKGDEICDIREDLTRLIKQIEKEIR